ncbi:helix-turn-helix domain-containing protein [Paenibacillus sediminis]|uniref:Cytoskeletal protein RodZ n=1 Tax=Paenibacillus sediminis TaxID=664909 RepID=A0ABS4H2L1_9BACL|nr:helix-turn-helix domain-containing protein [Paenibacillus sediminis]MBP1936355.1 cytoskeletal protein RodZ [Paenibacillus sediminis]
MSDLGQQLKEARLQKGLTLDDVQEMTKIRKRYLEAIEAGDYKVLPGSFYVRAFIKTYAEAVGINPDELFAVHQMDIRTPEPEVTAEPIVQKRSNRQSSDRNSKWISTVLMWTFPILIIAVIYLYVSSLNDKKGVNKVDPTKVTTEQANPADLQSTTPANSGDNAGGTNSEVQGNNGASTTPETQPPAVTEPNTTKSAAPVVTEDRKEGSTTVFKVTPADAAPVKVEIKATGKSWVEVRKGSSKGEKLFYANMNNGDDQTYELDGQGLFIKSGNSPATEITVGGQVVTDGKLTSKIQLELGSADSAGSQAESTSGTNQTGEANNQTDSTQVDTTPTTANE